MKPRHLFWQGLLVMAFSLLLCEAIARFVFPEPRVLNFNRIQFTQLADRDF